MSLKPTIIGSVVRPAEPPPSPSAAISTGAIVLSEAQLPMAERALSALDFAGMAPGDIVQIGFKAEQALQRTLDGFLARIDRKTAAKVFDLFGRLQRGVDDANLPEILERLQQGEQPSFFASLVHKVTRQTPEEIRRRFMDEVGELVTGRTRTLADEMQRLEAELTREMAALFDELRTLDALKRAYRTHFDEFTVDAAVARALLERARGDVAQQRAALDASDVVGRTRLQDLENKLQLLESRALALEGVYTRLPADQLVIQQIEQAGVATLQETATTIAARFASIKMTLLSIHGAFAVTSVQQLSERQARMDEQLTKLRGMALKDVAVTAAKAPGDNRLSQAHQIESVIASTRETHDLVQAARQETEQKFEAARQRFAQARAELATLASR